MIRILLLIQETRVQSLGQEDLLEKEMATQSHIIAWKIPWTEEAGGLPSMGSPRVGHGLVTKQQQQVFQAKATDKCKAPFSSSSVTQSCLTFCDPMDCSSPGFPVHHQLLELTQTHVHWVGDAIQPSHPLSFPFSSPSIFPNIRVFSNESALLIRCPKHL